MGVELLIFYNPGWTLLPLSYEGLMASKVVD